MCLKYIGFRVEDSLTILDPIVNIIGGALLINYWEKKEPSSNNERDIHMSFTK